MALINTITLERPGFAGQLSADAYWRASVIEGGKTAIRATFEALVSGERIDTLQLTFEPDMSPDAPNFIAQAYGHAKLSDRLAGARDA